MKPNCLNCPLKRSLSSFWDAVHGDEIDDNEDEESEEYMNDDELSEKEYSEIEEEVKGLDGIDNVIQECIDQDSSEHSDKSNWIVEEV